MGSSAAQDFGATLNSYLPSWSDVAGAATRAWGSMPTSPVAAAPAIVSSGVPIAGGFKNFLTGLVTGRPSVNEVGEQVPLAQGATYALPPVVAKPTAPGVGPAGSGSSDPRKAFADALAAGVAQSLGIQPKSSGSTAPAGSPTFAGMANQLQAAQGGKISLNQMAQLARIGQEAYIRPVRPWAQDVAIGQYMKAENDQFASSQAAAQDALSKATTDDEKKAAIAQGQSAVKAHLQNMQMLALSRNPMNDVLAQMMMNGQAGGQ